MRARNAAAALQVPPCSAVRHKRYAKQLALDRANSPTAGLTQVSVSGNTSGTGARTHPHEAGRLGWIAMTVRSGPLESWLLRLPQFCAGTMRLVPSIPVH